MIMKSMFLDDLSTNIDMFYDYHPLSAAERSGRKHRFFPARFTPSRVAIIGGGISGLIAATELLRAGVSDVTLFETHDRLGEGTDHSCLIHIIPI